MGGQQVSAAAVAGVLLLAAAVPTAWAGDRTFLIEDDRFVADGKPVQLIGGCLHYFRIPRPFWRDRLLKLKAMGLNTIQFYVPWNFHERVPGEFTWEGEADLEGFIQEIQDAGMIAMLRPGPYICAEWDFGGLPWWLANSKTPGGRTMELRSDDPHFLAHVEAWWKVLLAMVKPYLWQNGGPIAMVQIENEYGFCGPSYGHERTLAYLRALVKMARDALGDDVILYTTDPPNNAPNGTIPGDEVFTAVDFGAGWWQLADAFGKQKALNAPGKSPPICTEFYTGWLTHWGENMANTSAYTLVSWMDRILSYQNNSGSFAFYMAHGGTNFGFWAGANLGDSYQPHITSYDYDAPLSEAGGYGQPGIGGPNKYEKIRDRIADHLADTGMPSDLPEVLPASPVMSYGKVSFGDGMPLLRIAQELAGGKGVQVDKPDIMEEYGQRSGLVLYRTVLSLPSLAAADSILRLSVHDYAQVFLNGVLVGAISRNDKPPSSAETEEGAAKDGGDVSSQGQELVIPAASIAAALVQGLPDYVKPEEVQSLGTAAAAGDGKLLLDVLVEAMGRSNFGCEFDHKGIINPSVTLDGQELTGWLVLPLPLDNLEELAHVQEAAAAATVVDTLSVPAQGVGQAQQQQQQLGSVQRLQPAAVHEQRRRRRLLQDTSQAGEASPANTTAGGTDDVGDLGFGPELLVGAFEVPEGIVEMYPGNAGYPPDTFLHLPGFGKGIAWVNGFNLGWYWPDLGPQMRLYVPGTALVEGTNQVWILETDKVPREATVELVDEPDFFGPGQPAGLGTAAQVHIDMTLPSFRV